MDSHTSSNFTASSEGTLPQGSNSGFFPNAPMYMGPMPWQPLYVPQPNATAQVNDASANATVVPLSGVGAGDGHNSFQSTQPFSVVNIANATYNQSFINPYPAHPAVAIPQQHSFVSPPQYNPSSFPLGAFPGITQPQIYGIPQLPFPLQNAHLEQHSTEFGSTSLQPQATAPSTRRKRRKDREEARRMIIHLQISEDAEFKALGEADERGNQRFKCLRECCGKVIIAASYLKHIKTGTHRGDKRGTCVCQKCGQMLSRSDSVKRHQLKCDQRRAKLETPPSGSDTRQGSMSPASSVAVPTASLTFREPETVPSMSGASPTSDVGNMQMTPLANSFTQALNADAFADSLVLPVPDSSESAETTVAPAPDIDLMLADENLHADVIALFETWCKNNVAPLNQLL